MGWRETMGGADSGMNAPTQYPQNTQNPERTPAPVTEPGGFGDIGGFGYGVETEKPTAPRTRAGLRLTLTEACEGLPVTLAELMEAFGAEGEADWLESYEPHCRPEFLRAFAATVAERLAREGAAKPEPEAAPEPNARAPDGSERRGMGGMPHEPRWVPGGLFQCGCEDARFTTCACPPEPRLFIRTPVEYAPGPGWLSGSGGTMSRPPCPIVDPET